MATNNDERLFRDKLLNADLRRSVRIAFKIIDRIQDAPDFPAEQVAGVTLVMLELARRHGARINDAINVAERMFRAVNKPNDQATLAALRAYIENHT